MSAHVFLVSEDNFEICINRGVYGCVLPSTEWNKAEIIAGIFSIQPNDLVFFYVKNRGVYGLWKVVGEPYFDLTKVWPNDQQFFPFRFSFEPIVSHFPTPISLNDVLDLHDKGRIWTFDLNPVQQKNQYKITTNEARELLRLLLRNNPIQQEPRNVAEPYIPLDPQKIDIDFSSICVNGRIRYEGWLNAWIMRSLARCELKDQFGEYKEFINLVPTSFNKVLDVFLTHVTTIDSIEIVYKYTCIELKIDRASEQDLTQILRYEKWLSHKLAQGDDQMIQSVLIAKHFSDGVLDYVNKRNRIEEKSVNLMKYEVDTEAHNIKLVAVTP
jgi:hypothetical protein